MMAPNLNGGCMSQDKHNQQRNVHRHCELYDCAFDRRVTPHTLSGCGYGCVGDVCHVNASHT